MADKQSHIDQLIREKFEQFHPEPPAHIWAGIEQGLATGGKPVLGFQYGRQLAVAAALVFLALLLWYVIPENKQEQLIDIESADQAKSVEKENTVAIEPGKQEMKTETNSAKDEPLDDVPDASRETPPALTTTAEVPVAVRTGNNAVHPQNQTEFVAVQAQAISRLDNKAFSPIQLTDGRDAYPGNGNESVIFPENRKELNPKPLPPAIDEMAGFKNYWNIGLYFTPEMMLNNFDSVTLMNTYSLNIEPSYYFSKHWFVRFGAGLSYVRDRGFAKTDYLSKDYIGSYDSVVNITFDTINSELFPVYHTKEVEIWDSIRHLAVSEVTNKYYNLQLPLLFGYHNSSARFKWYFYGGPTINIAIIQQFEDPQAGVDYIEIIQMENSLPQRTTYSMQMWVGAGIDFRIGEKTSLALEPNYRYYFKPNYKENNYKTALSGLSLRFGLIYKLN
ncbi:MAG: PorT family protein [Bacteroidales bacterium]|nr:PorT family protein [Bacteroidales bacterium]MCF6342649.1 PorT family protein [Bacteroidales bacterium]